MAKPNGLADRLAAAPISWGVCEVPGWGLQLSPQRVLAEMRDLGVAATEFGPDGFLPDAPAEKAKTLAGFGLRAVGGFVPVVLHDASVDPVPGIEAQLESFVAAGAVSLVLSADTGRIGYDSRPTLTERHWDVLLANLDRLAVVAAERGVVASIHPHVGTLVESADDVARVLEGSRIGLCLDTGHLLIGGTDPVALAAAQAARVSHVHLKDVRVGIADGVRRGDLSYTEAVRDGLYTPLGAGDIDIATIVSSLEAAGYNGYYVLEQDTILTELPQPGRGPVEDVRESLEFISSLTWP
ncbi:TIM barrel protein [Lacisediminihabitans profunda]|uniref:TIM barrel protein n=1 Tax=Lacisediminihabitans profunda TaxID=2594790 RepID=A0A5C8UUB5_9MICO|nr:TIM barrel protein [Lacisediminihabitans profunda]TXN31179.1 TIM barrel protein [Lacisediminihabitans profunda]